MSNKMLECYVNDDHLLIYGDGEQAGSPLCVIPIDRDSAFKWAMVFMQLANGDDLDDPVSMPGHVSYLDGDVDRRATSAEAFAAFHAWLERVQT